MWHLRKRQESGLGVQQELHRACQEAESPSCRRLQVGFQQRDRRPAARGVEARWDWRFACGESRA